MPHQPQDTLNFAYKTYKSIAKASRNNKKQMREWQIAILYLTIAATVVGGMAGYVQKVPIARFTEVGIVITKIELIIKKSFSNDPNFSLTDAIGKWLGFLGAILLAVVSYFSSRVLSNDKNQSWQNMRSIAEAIKSKCFLFACSQAEYAGEQSKEKIALFLDQIHDYTNSLQNDIVLDTDESFPYPIVPMDVEQYMIARYDNQYNYYKKEIIELYSNVSKSEKITLSLGLISVILSVAATYFDVAVLIALFTAITSTVTSYFSLSKSRELLLRYSATCKQLEIVREKYYGQVMDDGKFISEVERILNNENSAWMNLYTN